MAIVIKEVLCPVDFSRHSEHALQYALAFTEAYNAHLEILHVVNLPLLPSYWLDEDVYPVAARVKELSRQPLDELVGRCHDRHARVTGTVVEGTPFVEIVRAAKANDVDLIVMASHGRSGLKHVLIGGTAEKVVRQSPCPVLIVKHPEHEFVSL